jgi:ABC-type transport system involved in multi-copper enzyme maturation permease subunit
MSDALRFEWIRLITLRSTYWLIGLSLVLNAAVAGIVGFATRNNGYDELAIGTILTGGGPFSTMPFAAVFMAVIGIFATGHEYRHGTIQPTLTTIPQRSRVLGAKLLTVAAIALVVAVVSLVIDFAIGMIYWERMPDFTAGPLGESVIGYVILVVLWSVLGLALAQFFRGVPSALTVILVVPLVVEGLITTLTMVPALDWLQPVVKFLPFTAGKQLMSLGDFVTGEDGPMFETFDRWPSGGVFAAFVLIVLVAAWTLFKRRDA